MLRGSRQNHKVSEKTRPLDTWSIGVWIASGIRPFLEAQEELYRSQAGFILGVFSRSLSQRRFDNGVSLSIHKTGTI
jgi:hypothetical protein